MKVRRAAFSLVSVLFSLVLFSNQAFACACCSNEGDYHIGFRKPANYELSLMGEMKFGPKANLIASEAGIEEHSKGLPQPVYEYTMKGELVGNSWRLSFSDKNRTATLSLPLPPRMLSFKADIHDGQKSGGGGPLLYKEWRFEGRPSGTGFFKGGLTPTAKYFLVLQGRGNSCDNSADFGHWRLEITGPRADYAFYGDMESGAVAEEEEEGHSFSVTEYERFHDVLHPLEHEALPNKDFKTIRTKGPQLIELGQSIVRVGVPAGTNQTHLEQFKSDLKKFADALTRFGSDIKTGTDDQLKQSYSSVHDTFEILVGMLPRRQ